MWDIFFDSRSESNQFVRQRWSQAFSLCVQTYICLCCAGSQKVNALLLLLLLTYRLLLFVLGLHENLYTHYDHLEVGAERKTLIGQYVRPDRVQWLPIRFMHIRWRLEFHWVGDDSHLLNFNGHWTPEKLANKHLTIITYTSNIGSMVHSTFTCITAAHNI